MGIVPVMLTIRPWSMGCRDTEMHSKPWSTEWVHSWNYCIAMNNIKKVICLANYEDTDKA